MGMAKITLKIKRFDTKLPIPDQKTKGATCFDLYTRLDTTIEPHQIGYIPLNTAAEIPPGYWGMLAVRSSTHKFGLMPANGIGVFDEDFSGDEDEFKFIVYNFTDQPVTITRGTRIAQMAIFPKTDVEFVEVDSLDNPTRGGLGSTGHN